MKPCWLQWAFFVCVVVLGTGQMLTACGNKGPLVLPGEQATDPRAPDQPAQPPSQRNNAD
ncbi:lipoprotein [Granulosicoccaceae sp. 1_MG-2023]|nr:lipoprotein [Granulosicoccaceae sp. 1_MG-2023]